MKRSEKVSNSGGTPDQYKCKISHDLMSVPYMCPDCSSSFDGVQPERWLPASHSSAVKQDFTKVPHPQSTPNKFKKPCPFCKKVPKEFTLSKSLRDATDRYKTGESSPRAGGGTSRAGGGTSLLPSSVFMDASNPYCAVFIGKSGAGKSKTTSSTAGREVCESKNSAGGVTQVPSTALSEVVLDKKVMPVDAPGLLDPEKDSDEVLEQLTALLGQKVDGLDAVPHVVKVGRLDDSEVQVPRVVLESLASSPKERQDLAKRYKIVVTYCDSSDDEGFRPEQAVAELRGRLLQVLPKELESTVRSATFVEHSQRFRSNYNDLDKFRRQFLTELVSCRSATATGYRPKLLTDAVNESRAELEKTLRTNLSIESLSSRSYDELTSLQGFFRLVQSAGKWEKVRATDRLPDALTRGWSELQVVNRDRLAVEVAQKVNETLRQALKQAVEKREKELQEARRKLEREEEARRTAESRVNSASRTQSRSRCAIV